MSSFKTMVSTGNAQIVNFCNYQVWGIGPDSDGKNFTITEADSKGSWPEEWRCTNVQGKALMRVRDFHNAPQNSKFTRRSFFDVIKIHKTS